MSSALRTGFILADGFVDGGLGAEAELDCAVMPRPTPFLASQDESLKDVRFNIDGSRWRSDFWLGGH
jgi:hypothetical protein